MIELTQEKKLLVKGPDADNLVWLVLNSGLDQIELSFPAGSIEANALVSWRDGKLNWPEPDENAWQPAGTCEQVIQRSNAPEMPHVMKGYD